MIVRVERHPTGRRVYLLGRYRCHHGATGLALIAIGLILIADDAHDFPWLKDTP